MQIDLTIPGSIRSKKNSKRIFARGRFKKVLPSTAYEKWEKQARTEAWAQIVYACSLPANKLPSFPLDCPIHVKAYFYYKGNKPDLAGAMESISDCLEGICYQNDGQIVSWDGSRTIHDLKNPHTSISIWWNEADAKQAEEFSDLPF